MKKTLYDRDELKLIERLCDLRETYPNMKVMLGERPLVLGGISDGVYSAEVEY
ncbi:MAG: hypothetical protein HW410_1441 [Nitrosarchaeum sp.]|nr:hypothetical protein [Nitrosarchaeum sp.]